MGKGAGMSKTVDSDYVGRFHKVLKYIDEHLDAELPVEKLASVVAFSKYHFHRQFAALFGTTVQKYVQMLRLKRASYKLAFRNDSITEIALECCYEGPEAFSRAFKKRFEQSPADFRRQPNWAVWQRALEPVSESRLLFMKTQLHTDQVQIVVVDDTQVASLEHRGSPALIGESVRRFIAWRKQFGLPPSRSSTFNILYDDPEQTPPDEFRLAICAATNRDIPPNDAGVTAATIEGGRCAVLRHVGSDDNLGQAVGFLYRVWLPQSGEEPRDFPLYCQRVSFFPDVPEHEAITDIFLPLR